jgi:hypothetical protein
VAAVAGDIPLGLMQTLLPFRLSRMPHERHIKEKRIGNGSSYKTGDAAFYPATPHDLQYPTNVSPPTNCLPIL